MGKQQARAYDLALRGWSVVVTFPFCSSFPDGSGGKESAYNAGDPGLIPGQEDPMEKGMATHSSILVWRIPWTEEPGILQSLGSQCRTRLID